MISPHTAPGTKVVVIKPTSKYHSFRIIPHLKVGETYTIDHMVLNNAGSVSACLAEVDHKASHTPPWKFWRRKMGECYPLFYFDYAALPSCLTEILNSEIVKWTIKVKT